LLLSKININSTDAEPPTACYCRRLTSIQPMQNLQPLATVEHKHQFNRRRTSNRLLLSKININSIDVEATACYCQKCTGRHRHSRRSPCHISPAQQTYLYSAQRAKKDLSSMVTRRRLLNAIHEWQMIT